MGARIGERENFDNIEGIFIFKKVNRRNMIRFVNIGISSYIQCGEENTISVDRVALSTIKKQGTNLNELTGSDPFIAGQLNTTMNDSNILLQAHKISEAINFIIWNDTWNDYGIFGPNRDKAVRSQASLRYSRGRKVFVDFGCGNIGKETSMPHPAFIIYNFSETAVVVPTTSDDGSLFTADMEKALIRCPKDGNVFPRDTIINLHQIRAIQKNRIISDLKCNAEEYLVPNMVIDSLNKDLLRGTISYGINLKKLIELKLAELYCPDIFIKMYEYKNRLDQQSNYLTELKETNEEQQRYVQQLKDIIKKQNEILEKIK